MPRTILLPFDGSRTSVRALRYAAALARLGDEPAGVLLLTVLPDAEGLEIPEHAGRAEVERAAQRQLASAARRLRKAGIAQVDTLTVWDEDAADAILQVSDDRNVEMIVSGTHGRSGLNRALVGSVALTLMQHADRPTVFVPPGSPLRDVTIRSIVYPVDGSTLAEQALPIVEPLAKAGVRVHVVRVVPPSATLVPFAMPGAQGYIPVQVVEDLTAAAEVYVSEFAKRLGPGRAEPHTLIGTPARAITDFANEHKADLIVMTTHGRGAIGRVVMGSVADQVVRTARMPVLVYRPEQ
ncbi:MAG TPA: universal stress protein [Dehalococcoidia bacterium]|nr:universal stress protein [Dehalococcoidia bacterium]